MNKLLLALLSVISLNAVACSEWFPDDCNYNANPYNQNGMPKYPEPSSNMQYDIYRNGNTTTIQPHDTYKGRYGFDLPRNYAPITCTTIGRNTYCN